MPSRKSVLRVNSRFTFFSFCTFFFSLLSLVLFPPPPNKVRIESKIKCVFSGTECKEKLKGNVVMNTFLFFGILLNWSTINLLDKRIRFFCLSSIDYSFFFRPVPASLLRLDPQRLLASILERSSRFLLEHNHLYENLLLSGSSQAVPRVLWHLLHLLPDLRIDLSRWHSEPHFERVSPVFVSMWISWSSSHAQPSLSL